MVATLNCKETFAQNYVFWISSVRMKIYYIFQESKKEANQGYFIQLKTNWTDILKLNVQKPTPR